MRPLTAGTGDTIFCDVLVAGGGVSGVAAAVASARSGCRVVLIEKEKALGGAGTRGMLRTICGLYLNGAEEPAETLNRGIVREIVSRLRALAPHRTVAKVGKVFVLPCSSDDLGQVLESLCRQEPNLVVSPGTTGVSVASGSGRITDVIATHGGNLQSIRPRAMIDCTGSGDAAVLAGAEFDLASPEDIQMAGYTVRVRGIRDRKESLAIKVPYVLAGAVKDRELPPNMRYTTFGMGDAPDEGYLKFSAEGADSAEREQRAQEDAEKAFRILADRLPAFREASIAGTSQGVLDREGRRIRGEYVLTEEDVLSARKFPDGVVKNAWPIELWDRHKGPVYKYVPDGDYYEIPLRCLIVKGFSNLLAAGRCISVTHEALGSTRVMGACMALGDVAGHAAAALVKAGRYPAFGT